MDENVQLGEDFSSIRFVLSKTLPVVFVVLISCLAFTQKAYATKSYKNIFEKRFLNESRPIKGQITDKATGEALIGVSVRLKESEIATVTDVNGDFFLNAPQNGILIISYVGYKTIEVPIANKSTINILLESSTKSLNEVVVVGYGTSKKSDLTGSVASLKASELTSAPSTNTASALQGRIAGVMVQNTSGDPSATPTIRIRGANSITFGNDPLVVIDGVEGGQLGNLNTSEVESIQVLKDAAALSIYGSRGANGVILVTTKSGKGGMRISFDSYLSSDQVIKKLPSLNATDYANLFNSADVELGKPAQFSPSQVASFGNGTNWQNAIFRNGLTQNDNINIGGSKEGISYFIASGFINRSGIILNTNYNQYTLRGNLKIQATPKLSVSLNSFFSYNKSNDGDAADALVSALEWSPTQSIYNAGTGGYSQPQGGGVGPVANFNPVGLAKEIVQDNYKTVLNLSPTAEYIFSKNLKISSQLAYRQNNNFSGYFNNQVVNDGPATNVSGSINQSWYSAIQNTNIITYDKTINDHNFKLTGVYEINKDQFHSSSISATGIPAGLGYNGLSFGSVFLPPYISLLNTAGESFVGRLNYNYKSRYLITISDRYDGASQLADGHKYENFGAVSAGWNIMNENFMENLKTSIPELKLRASYGSVGNAAVPSYSSEQLFNASLDANGNPVITLKQLANPNLKWERTTEANLGIDGKLLKGRLDFTIEYYNKKTTNLLEFENVPSALGVTSVLTNVGSVSNKGIDFSIGGSPVVTGNFKWSSNFTLNYNQNKILALAGSDTVYYSSNADYPGVVGSFANIVGQPMGSFLGFKSAGVWQQSEASSAALYGAKPGDAKYVDVNRDGKINNQDITIIGNAQPKFTFGWNNTFTYKAFDLNMFWQGVTGNQIYNENAIRRESFNTNAFPTSPVISNHWTPTNPSNIPAFSGVEQINESRWVESGSYLRLKNISFGYQLPANVLAKTKAISGLRIYVSATNMITITKYSGYDPEASIGADASAAGVDRSIYPSQKSIIVGLNIKL